MLNYDADSTPDFSPEAFQFAEDYRLHPVAVTCLDGDDHVQVTTLCSFIPRIGERIELDDGKLCEVKRVYYKTSTRQAPGSTKSICMLVPNVLAVRIKDRQNQQDGTE